MQAYPDEWPAQIFVRRPVCQETRKLGAGLWKNSDTLLSRVRGMKSRIAEASGTDIGRIAPVLRSATPGFNFRLGVRLVGCPRRSA